MNELQARVFQVREAVTRSTIPIEPQTLNLLERLEELVNRADDVIEDETPQPVSNRVRA